MTTPRIDEMVEKLGNDMSWINRPNYKDTLAQALTKAYQAGRDEAMKKINKKYWLNPKRSKKDIAKENAWNDLGNTLRNGV